MKCLNLVLSHDFYVTVFFMLGFGFQGLISLQNFAIIELEITPNPP